MITEIIPHWLWEFMGLNGSNSWAYFWGDFGGSFIMTLILGLPIYLKHFNCVQHRCPRLGMHTYTHPTKGTVRSCRKHHPHIDHTKRIHLEEWAKEADDGVEQVPEEAA